MWITFSASAQESADLTLASPMDSKQLAASLEPCAWWRGKPSAARSWARRCSKGSWTTVLSGAVILPSYRSPRFPASTGTSEAFPASPFPTLVNGEGRTIGDTCGPSSESNLLFSSQGECFLRTWPECSHSVSVICSQTWKELASDVRSACTQRRKSALRTAGTASSSLDWPTPTQKNSPRHTTTTGVMHSGTSLVDAIRLWPTPTANEDACGTPNGKMQRMLGNHPEIRGPLDPDNSKPSGSRSVLNPQFVEALMGFQIGWTDCGR